VHASNAGGTQPLSVCGAAPLVRSRTVSRCGNGVEQRAMLKRQQAVVNVLLNALPMANAGPEVYCRGTWMLPCTEPPASGPQSHGSEQRRLLLSILTVVAVAAALSGGVGLGRNTTPQHCSAQGRYDTKPSWQEPYGSQRRATNMLRSAAALLLGAERRCLSGAAASYATAANDYAVALKGAAELVKPAESTIQPKEAGFVSGAPLETFQRLVQSHHHTPAHRRNKRPCMGGMQRPDASCCHKQRVALPAAYDWGRAAAGTHLLPGQDALPVGLCQDAA
jgi:hypothetical protein